MTRTLLAFDTSTDGMSISLTGPHGVRLHESAGGARASARLVPEVLALLGEAGCALSDVDAIGFGCGPGAFTGLRTACSVAQGLAFGAGKPVVPVGSLLLVAESARLPWAAQNPVGSVEFEVWVAMDARMDEIYAAAYRWAAEGGQPASWQVIASPALYTVEALRACWQAAAPRQVAGSAPEVFGERLGLDAAATRLLRSAEGSRAAALASLMPLLWAQGAAVDAAQALPVYVREKVAQTTAERDAARAARESAA